MFDVIPIQFQQNNVILSAVKDLVATRSFPRIASGVRMTTVLIGNRIHCQSGFLFSRNAATPSCASGCMKLHPIVAVAS